MIETDKNYRESQVKEVAPCNGGWTITDRDGWSFFVPDVGGIQPQVGQTVRFYGRGLGFPVRGLTLDGRVVFYRTEAEQLSKEEHDHKERERKQREHFQASRAKLDADYDALPAVFQSRLDKFRRNNPDFRWKYEEYEMFCCKQAVVIADALRELADCAAGPHERKALYSPLFDAFREYPWEKQRKMIPDISDEHSGNTFGCAMRLAYLYLTHEEGVEQLHGALAPLVGSEKYGCVPGDGDE